MTVPLSRIGGWLGALLGELALWGGVLLLLASVLSVYVGLNRRRVAERVETTPRSDVGDVRSPGVFRVRGTVRPQASVDTFTAPISADEECVLSAWEIDERYDTPKTRSWERSAWGVHAVPFYVTDDSGELPVDIDDLTVGNDTDDVFTPESILASEGVSVPGLRCEFDSFDVHVETGYEDAPPDRVAEFLDRTDGVSLEPMATDLVVDACERKYSEETLQVGDEVSVMGYAAPKRGDSVAPSHPRDLVVRQAEEATLHLSTRPFDHVSGGGGSLLFGLLTGVVGLGLVAMAVLF